MHGGDKMHDDVVPVFVSGVGGFEARVAGAFFDEADEFGGRLCCRRRGAKLKCKEDDERNQSEARFHETIIEKNGREIASDYRPSLAISRPSLLSFERTTASHAPSSAILRRSVRL